MERLSESPVLEYQPDTIDRVRRMYGLEKDGRIKDDVRILREWLDKQPHILKKDFSDEYLEVMIISSKGSVERAKKKIDKYCTLRTLTPRFFDTYNVKEDLKDSFKVFPFAVLPKTTEDFYRIFFVTFANSHCFTAQIFLDHMKYVMMVCEYLLAHDYYQGCVVILNLMDFNITDMLTGLNINDLSHFFTLLIEAYGMRMKGLNFVTDSKVINTFVGILKSVMNEKVASRIKVHKTMDTVYEVVPKELLPSDFGGKEKTLREIEDDWIEVISSKENIKYLKEMSKACTDESLRPRELNGNGDALGVAGTFRKLNLD